jgi:hypothetical protein
MPKMTGIDQLPTREVHAEVLPAVYVHFTDHEYQHVYISGFDLKDALENVNRWKYYQRRDKKFEPIVVLDNVDDNGVISPR